MSLMEQELGHQADLKNFGMSFSQPAAVLAYPWPSVLPLSQINTIS